LSYSRFMENYTAPTLKPHTEIERASSMQQNPLGFDAVRFVPVRGELLMEPMQKAGSVLTRIQV